MGICSYNLFKHLIIIILKNATNQNLSPKCGQSFSKKLIKKEGKGNFIIISLFHFCSKFRTQKKKKDVPNIISPQHK
jgi:hypothetical protein